MQVLVKFIGLTLLITLSTLLTGKQEVTELQNATPQKSIVYSLHSKQPISEKTLAYLFTERLAMPINATSEVPSYQLSHSKHKNLHNTHRSNRYNTQTTLSTEIHHHSVSIHHHVIDYYIYTLEHIRI